MVKKIARFGHQFYIMKHDVDEIKISFRHSTTFNTLRREISVPVYFLSPSGAFSTYIKNRSGIRKVLL